MKKNAIKNIGIGMLFMITLAFVSTHQAKASELDGNYVNVESFNTSARGVKVMDGISEVVIGSMDRKSKREDKFVLQCDSTTESLNVFYYLHNDGKKITGSEGMTIQVYAQNDDKATPNARTVYDSTSDKVSLHQALLKISAMDEGTTFVFRFFKLDETYDPLTVGYSMMIPKEMAQEIMDKFEEVDMMNDCDIHSEFTGIYSLKDKY